MNQIQNPEPPKPPQKKDQTWVAVLLGVISGLVGITTIIIVIVVLGFFAIVGLILFTCGTH